jgi:hypothetical protein
LVPLLIHGRVRVRFAVAAQGSLPLGHLPDKLLDGKDECSFIGKRLREKELVGGQ